MSQRWYSPVVVGLSLLLPSLLSAQPAVVTRNVYLRTGPSTSRSIIRKHLPGDELALTESGKTQGYYHVQDAQGDEGWVWGNNVHVLTDDTPVVVTTAGPPQVFNGCVAEGSAKYKNRQALNRLKNRVTAPTPADIDAAITLAAILAPGDDASRWHSDQGAQVTGFVDTVKAGHGETVNCGATGQANTDTHIEISLSGTPAKIERVIVEVTPRWRWFMDQHGTDWSTPTLRGQLLHRCATFTGWMFFDDEHDDEAENTAPGREANFRATAWELHPVTAIQVVPCPN